MKPLQVSEFILLSFMVVVLPFSWFLTTRIMAIFFLNTVVRVVVERHLGNSHLARLPRMCVIALAALYLYLLFTMTYTDNAAFGWNILLHRLPLLVFAVCALAVDTSYFCGGDDAPSPCRDRRRVLMWLFVATLIVKFFVRFYLKVVVGHSWKLLHDFDPVHHTYMAMYLLFALGFLYSELFVYKGTVSRKRIWAVAVSSVVLTVYTIFVASRTGIAGLIVMAASIVAHQIFGLKQVRRGLFLLGAAVAVTAAVFFIIPDKSHRLTNTLKEMTEGDTSDVRYFIMGSSVKAIGESMPFGVGVGDSEDVLKAIYSDAGKTVGYNSHNIYLDVTLSMGIPGLLLLLTMLVLPVIWGARDKDITLLACVFAVAFCGLFEAILNRQMGILFVGLFWFVMFAGRGKR